MTSSQIRQSFLDFFARKGHRIVPSAPVIPHGDPTLLFTNAGMNQFKDVFLGTGRRDYLRAADSQKCIRVSGKHNDLEEVGRDTYHHTFFEMLGNWSFGDYYKEEAIAWAWELLTNEWGLDKRRLYATVFDSDDESQKLWNDVTDIASSHILRFGAKDNFWEMGETGPCGPCSEIHIDLTHDLSGEKLVNAGDGRVIEIWNLVFIQNNRNEKGELERLPTHHVDTGMGFERVCAVMQGKDSNYDTDLFMPIIEAIGATTGRPYKDKDDQVAMRVIADHVRMLSFAIADGAIPGNDGRGYVLRRILRRAARFGRNLGMKEPFIHAMVSAVVESMGEYFPELVEKQTHIRRVIRAEEESFNLTLDRGLEIFDSVLARIGPVKVFPGDDAFRLYDTFGFPLDLTELMAVERGLMVDAGAFTKLMEEQRQRSRRVSAEGVETAGATDQSDAVVFSLRERARNFDAPPLPTEFVGYTTLDTDTTVVAATDFLVVLAANPFYAESGGQVGDAGRLEMADKTFAVRDTQKGRLSHVLVLEQAVKGLERARVKARVDRNRRLNIQRNHSATHLVHEALRRVLGTHVHQQGSLVAPDHLRFDFPHFGKIVPEEIRAIEDMVNDKIAAALSVHTEVDVPIEEARKMPNVKMFFGDRYGDVVRVVFIDESFSVEFCGGTHVTNTKEIGLFKIISESGIASGVRRIEAVSGDGLRRFIERQVERTGSLNEQIAQLIDEKEALEKELGPFVSSSPATSPGPVSIPAGNLTRAAIEELGDAVRVGEDTVERMGRDILDLRKKLSNRRVHQESFSIDGLVAKGVAVDGITLVVARVHAESLDELKSLGDALRLKLKSGVGILAAVAEEKVVLVCVVTDDLIAGTHLQAGKIVGALAKEVGGGGGGRPHLATAGGKDIAKLDSALLAAPGIVRAQLG